MKELQNAVETELLYLYLLASLILFEFFVPVIDCNISTPHYCHKVCIKGMKDKCCGKDGSVTDCESYCREPDVICGIKHIK